MWHQVQSSYTQSLALSPHLHWVLDASLPDKGKSAQLAGGHGLDRGVWREPGDKCLLESSVWRRKGWEEPRITNTGNEFSTTTSSQLCGPPLLYSPGAEQMLVLLQDEVWS